jgi:protein phosphatase
MIQLESAGLTNAGKVREKNEDACMVDNENQYYLVADGIGGHLSGEVASGIVVDTFKDCLKNTTADDFSRIDDNFCKEGNRLIALIHKSNELVYKRSSEDKNCRGMGSTVSAVCFSDSTLVSANVGDSPTYLIRNNEAELISFIHNVESDRASIDSESIKAFDPKVLKMLSRAIGAAEDVSPDAREIPCFAGDRVVICSDGLSNLVDSREIAEKVTYNIPEDACHILVDLANERGGMDNITVIVIEIKSVETTGAMVF